MCQCPGGGEGKCASGTDSDNPVVGLDDFAASGYQERLFFVADGEQSVEITEVLVGPPFFAELDRGAREVVAVLAQFALESLEQGESVRHGAREAGQYASFRQAANLYGA